MAKTPVTLKVDGYKDREVTEVSYEFSRGTSADGQPSGIARGGKITVTIKALNDGNCDMLEWINNTGKGKKGSLLFMDSSDQNKKMKEITFENAYCVKFTENWKEKGNDDKSPLNHLEKIEISCQKITNGQASYENEWA